jgi:DNA-binding transcriptional LysR family regulator
MIQQTSLRYFLAVADAKSIRAASEQLHIAQSAVSRQIQQLEAEVGVPLLYRLPQGVELTAAGELFLRYARHTAQQMVRLKAEVKSAEKTRRRHVRVGAMISMTHHVLPIAISRFRETEPDTTFEVKLGNYAELVELVLAGEADIGICQHVPLMDGTRVLFSYEAHVRAVTHRSHPLARLKRVAPADLVSADIALPGPASMTRRLIDEGFRREGMTIVPRLESNSAQMCLNLCAAGDMVHVLLSGQLSLAERYADLVWLPLSSDYFGTMRISAFRAPGKSLPPVIDDFRQVLWDTIMERNTHLIFDGGRGDGSDQARGLSS